MFANIYAGRKALVTGNTGFKGSWLSAWLLRLGADVKGLAISIPTHPSCFEELRLQERYQTIWEDIRDAEKVSRAIQTLRPEIIFHLAAQALVRESYRNPVLTFQTNMLGTLNVLEAARQCDSVKAVVVITSDKCYRNDEWVFGYRETDYIGGSDPYSASKGAAELISHAYFRSYFAETGPACATVRAGNVIGGGDWAPDRIVPDCARAWYRNQAAEIRNPDATRPWQHVLEPLSGYLWLGARLLDNRSGLSVYHPRGESFNFGPSADAIHTVQEVVTGLSRHWPGFGFSTGKADANAPKECGLLKLSCDKALAWLDWKATLDFDETIRYTADWYACFHAQNESGSMWDFTQGQIAAYHNAALNRGLSWAQN